MSIEQAPAKEISRHPSGIVTALTLGDIAPGVRYITYIPGNASTIERGEFTSKPGPEDYDEEDGYTATALIKMGADVISKTVYLQDVGVTPYQNGERWSTAVTIPDDSEE